MAKAAWLKLKKWYTIADTDVLAVAAVMDPRIKIAFFEKRLSWTTVWTSDLRAKVNTL
jgi:hypothetical protein